MKKAVLSLGVLIVLTLSFATSVSAEEYTINKGDTLWSISQEYNVTVNQLMDWNNLDSDLIYPNERLTVSNQSSSPRKTEDVQSNNSTYTVKSGDTLYLISQMHGITTDHLMRLNNLTTTLIHPGDQLTVRGQVKATVSQTVSSNTTASNTNQTSERNVVKEFTAEATAYTAFCSGCSGVTATGIDLRANPNQKVIAVDPNVIPLGSKVYVEGYGVAIAGDTGGAIHGNRVDVFIPNKQEALNFGRKSVTVQVLNE